VTEVTAVTAEYQVPPSWMGAGLEMRRLDSISVIEVAAWPGGEAALEKLLAVTGKDCRNTLHLAPHRYWLLNAAARSQILAAAQDLAVTEVSDALIIMRLSGPQALPLLDRALPIDLHTSQFASGDSATTVLDDITLTVLNRGDAIDVFCRRSLGAALWHALRPISEQPG